MAHPSFPTHPRIAITAGEPSGIGPDLLIELCQGDYFSRCHAEIIIIADHLLLQQRAKELQLPLSIKHFKPSSTSHTLERSEQHKPSELLVLSTPLSKTAHAGQLNTENASYVLNTLETAINGCVDGTFQAMVTAPVQKSVINDAGIPFSGHTEFLAEKTNTEQVVMMLTSDDLRVALVTTHLPLAKVPQHITQQKIEQVTRIINNDLKQYFGIASPSILALGLNPHAGEGGHMGREEIEEIIPAITQLRNEGINISDPIPADTAFTEKYLSKYDVVLAMYHDQGLPVLKYKGFGNAVNITLGLPIIRTSVDHGTALDLAGTGKADNGSLKAAIETAITMAKHRQTNK